MINEQAEVFILDRAKVSFDSGALQICGSVMLIHRRKCLKLEDSKVEPISAVSNIMLRYTWVVAPAELEGHLLDHPDVSDVCVVGLPDDFSGELPLAFVVLSADAQKRVSDSPDNATRTRAALEKVCCASGHANRIY